MTFLAGLQAALMPAMTADQVVVPSNPLTAVTWLSAFWAEDPAWTPPADGGAVSSWRNAGAGGTDAAQATEALQPTYRAGYSNLNGQPAIEFAGGHLAFGFTNPSSNPRTIFAVVYVDPSNTAANNGITGDTSSGHPGLGWVTNTWWTYDSTTLVNSSAAQFSPGPHSVFATFTTTTDSVTVDGETVISGEAGTGQTMTAPRIGSIRNGLNPMYGAIAFIGYYDGDMSAEDRAVLESWAQGHYGTPDATAVTSALRTTMGVTVELIHEVDLPYTAWPYGNVHYDAARDKLWIVYTAGDSHSSANREVFFRTLNRADDTLSARQSVSVSGVPSVVHGAAIAANGDYLLLQDGPGGYKVVRSTNGGASWLAGVVIADGNGPLAVRQNSPLFLTSTGRLLTFSSPSSSIARFVAYSDDDGATWTRSDNLATGVSLEAGFMESAGVVVMVVRTLLSSAPYTGTELGQYYYSTNDGATWSGPYTSGSLADTNNNPAAMIEHADDGVFEIFYGSRMNHASDAKPSIYQAVATGKQAQFGRWMHTNRVVIGEATLDGPNFGYPAAVRVGDTVYLFWYDGTDGDCSIFMKKGTR